MSRTKTTQRWIELINGATPDTDAEQFFIIAYKKYLKGDSIISILDFEPAPAFTYEELQYILCALGIADKQIRELQDEERVSDPEDKLNYLCEETKERSKRYNQ